MVDSRAKGARTELAARDLLRKHTGLNWERVPGSGALDEKHGLKGDLYIPNEKNMYCVEVKGYAGDHVTSALLTSKSPQLLDFWKQALRQGQQVKKRPLLIFKYDRSKFFVAIDVADYIPTDTHPYIFINREGLCFYIMLLEDWLQHEQPKFTA
ncbi:MAG: hypothetical protein ACK4M7_05870 [Burkholderiales bacterium]